MSKLRRWLTFSEEGPDPATMVLRWFALALGLFVVGASLPYWQWRKYNCTPWDDGLIVEELPAHCVLLPQPGFTSADFTSGTYGREGNRWIFRLDTYPGPVPKLFYVAVRPGARVAELSIRPDDPDKARVLTAIPNPRELDFGPLLQPDYDHWSGRPNGFQADIGFGSRWDWRHDFGNGQRIHLRGCQVGGSFPIGDLRIVALNDEKYYGLMCIAPPRGKK